MYCTPYYVIAEPATGEDSRVCVAGKQTIIVGKQSFTTSTNEATPSAHSVTITVDLSKVVEFEDVPLPLPRAGRKPFLKPALREIQRPWTAKWRLRQQRPRDGLRS